MLFYGQSSDHLSSNRRVETGNQGLICPPHLRPICPPRNPLECEFSEYMQRSSAEEIVVIIYSYHWANANNQLIMCWDNTSHFPGLPGFPDHIHDGATGEGDSRSTNEHLYRVGRHCWSKPIKGCRWVQTKLLRRTGALHCSSALPSESP
jgi:Family of unknown function (DUF6516)